MNINGGTITAQGGSQGAGIGGGSMGSGTVNINGGTVLAQGGYSSAGIGNGMGGTGGNIIITNGIVTAIGGNCDASGGAAGIGGGAMGTVGSVTITGGTVIATGQGAGAGIGRDYASSGTGNCSITGNAVVIATGGVDANGEHISATGDSDSWNGIVFQGDDGQVYGDVTLADDLTIPDDKTLTVPNGSTLTIPEGVTVEGSITNNGTVNNSGTVTGGIAGGTVNIPSTVSVTVSSSAAAYGSTVTLTANVTNATDGAVTFYRGDVETGTALNDGGAAVSNGEATTTVQLDGEGWTPSNSPYTITAVYSGGTGLLSGSDTGSLTVSKATPDALPDGPNILKEKTTTSITLNPVDNEGANIYGTIQYGYITGDETSVPEDRWQNSNAFTNLSPGTDYNFYTRYAGNDYYNPSNRSDSGYLITTLPSITTTSLTSGYVGVEYEAQLEASVADNKTVTWTLASGTTLPDGLTLDAETGMISGVPKETVTSHSFTVQASIDGIDSYEQITNTATLTITINAGMPDITVTTYNDTTKTGTFTYGDTITVSGKIAASATAPGTSTNAITQNQVGLYLGETELATADVGSDGSFTLSYDTSQKGIEATGTSQSLTVKYGGSSDLNSGSTTVQVTLSPKSVTAAFTGPTNKTYDGSTKPPEGLAITLSDGDVVEGDDVTVTADSIAYDDASVGEGKTITARELTLSGDDARRYSLSSNTATTTGAIQKAGQDAPTVGEGYEIDYTAETIAARSGFELATSAEAAEGSASLSLSPGEAETTVYVRLSETDTHEPSDWTAVTIPARPGAPEVSGSVNRIEGASTSMEYSDDGGATWTAFTEEAVAYLPAGTYLVRCSATDGAFASAPSERVYVRNPTPPVTTYPPAVDEAEGGSVEVEPERPRRGQTVTVTPVPEEGQEVRGVTVTGPDGEPVEVTDNRDGSFSFEQPAGRVTIAVAFGCDGGGLCPAAGLPDVDPSSWYHDAVDWAVTTGAMTGYGDGTFGPGNVLTRAEAATVLWRLAGAPGAEGNLPGDCDPAAFYDDAVRWAYGAGALSGYDEGSFGPADPMSREQVATVLWRLAGCPEAACDLTAFPDAGEVSGFAAAAMRWAVSEGVLSGGGTSRASARSTRRAPARAPSSARC